MKNKNYPRIFHLHIFQLYYLIYYLCLLNYLGIGAVYIASAALMAYIPLLLVVIAIWYVISHLL